MSEYKDPIVAKLITKLEAEGPAQLKGHYYNGDVILVPKQELPVCSIAKDNLQVTQADNMTDDHYMPLVINILLDYTKDLNQSYDIIAGVTSLYDMVEGRNPDYTLRHDTILYVLRKYQQLDNNLWLAVGTDFNSRQVTVDYGLGIQRRGPGIYSVEAVIRVTARLQIPRADLQ